MTKDKRLTRVLIVDDDRDIRANFSDILEDLGYETQTAGCGLTALDHVREQDFDIVLMDYKMPGMDGAELYREIKKVQPSVAAIMITAWAGSDGAQQALNAGTWMVLRKPVQIPKLLEHLELAAKAPLILVVDDDVEFCQTLWQLLNERRYRVALAHTEEDGIARAGDSRCQVAIVDLKLGDGDGRRVLERIHHAVPDAETVIVSGNPQKADEVRRSFCDRPVHGVCEKPIDVEQLLAMIESGARRN